MTTIKGYTDLEQSKKLAEILPIESADMHFERVYFEGHPPAWFIKLGEPIKSNDIIPCWSLAALLEQIPEKLFDNDGFSYELKIAKQKGLYYINYLDSEGRYYHVSANCMNTLVDACVDMIIKLHE
jgi:hypothetical protein